jgi:UDP-N-acetylenolpyruvoylglucosamine reductase
MQNFFRRRSGARADDIRGLVNLVKDRVEASGTMLETEIQFVGLE